jgi:1-deoxy-D-xylulose-5-phosphate synthase
LQNLPVVFALDRGGLVGADGPTHHGLFDFSYLRHIPNMVVMAPRNEEELRRALVTGLAYPGPFAFRYPRGNGLGVPLTENPQPLAIGKGEKLRNGKDVVIFAIGTAVTDALAAAEILSAEGLELSVVDARFVKPLDLDLLMQGAKAHPFVVTVEEHVLLGGFGSALTEALTRLELQRPVLMIGLPDLFIEQGSQAELKARYCIDAAGIAASIRAFAPQGDEGKT